MRPGANLTVAAMVALSASACSAGGGSSAEVTSGGPDQAVVATSDSWSADVGFSRRMIWHHQQDLAMAALALQTASASPQVKQVARHIQRTHDNDIRELEGWLRQWEISTSATADHATDGERYEGAVQSLKGSSGSQFDRGWLKLMLEHSAVTMRVARELPTSTTHADVAAMAIRLSDNEQGEIAAMHKVLQRY